MNLHKIITVGAGLLASGLLIHKAVENFNLLNTPDAGIFTADGVSRILLPIGSAIVAFPVGAWVAHMLMMFMGIGLPSRSKPVDPVDPIYGKVPPADGPGVLKAFAEKEMRALSSALAAKGLYDQVAIVGKIARDWGDK